MFIELHIYHKCLWRRGSSSSPTEQPPVTPTNNAPTANAGIDQSVATGSTVSLDGSASSDSDGDSINYNWSFSSVPSGSNAAIENATTQTPAFTADIDGAYVIELTVDDGQLTSNTDSVMVNSSTAIVVGLSYPIVDTNQLICYNSDTGAESGCTGAGHDADYAGNQPDYTLSSDGLTVNDNVTHLVWQQSNDMNGDGLITNDDKLSLSDAITYYQNLSLSGRDDWRLPSIKESYSLILFSGKDASSFQGTDTSSLTLFYDDIFQPAFGDTDAGQRIIDGQFASSTLYVSTTMNGNETMFGVNFVDGRIKGYPASDNKQKYVRYVAGNTDYGINSFVDNADTTITDQATGLMWQQNDAESSNWEDAISRCEADTTAGFDDWRLPNVKELQSIVDYTRAPAPSDGSAGSAAIDPLFNSTAIINEAGEVDWEFYWSSTAHVGHNGTGQNAAYVSFGRALGNMNGTILDVHGAGAQRSNDKVDVSGKGASSATGANGIYYYKGPQGDIMRNNNKFRCVRSNEPSNELAIQKNGSVNILLIVADDLGVDNVSGYKEQPNFTAQTPSIDVLVNEGVLFRNAWANPMCSPSRASLLTGRHAFRHGVIHPGAIGVLASAEETIADVLSLVGYKTALFGKWHLGNESGTYPTDQGFDYFSGSLGNLDSYFNWQKTQIISQGGAASTNAETGYATDVVASEALAWINNQTTPWFVELAFNAPHHVPPASRYSHITLTGNEGDECTNDGANNTDEDKDCFRAAVEAMDNRIDYLIDNMPLDDLANTLVIFVEDNGTPKGAVIKEAGFPFIKDHGKGTVYEGGINVPLVIWAGANVGLDRGEVNDKIQIGDLFSTIIELAGTTASSGVEIDSKSLIGYLDQQTTTPSDRDFLFSELMSTREGIDRWAISNGSIKYINNETVEECYNLDTDPGETVNEYSASNATTTICDALRDNRPQ